MKVGVFVSDFKLNVETLDRLKGETLGVFLVENGVYHACVKDGGNASPVLGASPTVFVLKEDLETRGYTEGQVDARAKVVTYADVVDLIFKDYPKLAWL